MTKIDDLLKRLQQEQPAIDHPDELTDRIMNSLPKRGAIGSRDFFVLEKTGEGCCGTATDRREENGRGVFHLRALLAAAACLLVLIGMGVLLFSLHEEAQPHPTAMQQKQSGADTKDVEFSNFLRGGRITNPIERRVAVVQQHTGRKRMEEEVGLQIRPSGGRKRMERRSDYKSARAERTEVTKRPKPQRDNETNLAEEETIGGETNCVALDNLHYASLEEKDSVYLSPACLDEFIDKLASVYALPIELTCSATMDSTMVSTVYVFPDNKEANVFSRLLQAAVTYSDEMPGYHLNFSHQQFFFELKDQRKQLQYRWIAERINGKILLYGTNAPIGVQTTSACYQEYRNELMHTNSIKLKTREI